ncbi:MAG: sigma 54-interacting transcriptional regulator [bacterium]
MTSLKDLAVKALRFADFTIENVKDIIFWVDENGLIVRFNEAACTTLHYTGDEFLTMHLHEIEPDRENESWQKYWQRLQKQQAMTYESRFVTKAGDILPVEISANYIEFENQGFSCIFAHDISERRRAATQIADLARFPAENPNPILRINREGEIIYANDGSEPLLKTWRCKVGQSLPDDLRPVINAVFEKQQNQEMEVICGRRYFAVLLAPFAAHDYVNLYASDITQRKKAEAALRTALSEVEQLKNRLQAENIYLQEEIKVEHNFDEIVSRGEKFNEVLKKIEQVAKTDATVLLLGETGTGKELLARAIHHISSRNERPLVKVNCAALPANLIESELFGHEKGAFTGAIARKIGRFELADGGTLFLDEIGDLPLDLQGKLLRMLQEGEFERLGSAKTLRVDVRIIAATNRDLAKAALKGDFRQDLYYRLNVFPIECPPLRERKEDIPLLVHHFLKKFNAKTGKNIGTIPEKVMQSLTAYPWPGNVRELENIVERAVIISSGTQLQLGDWLQKPLALADDSPFTTLEEHERQHILQALELTNWRVRGKRGAAEILGMKPTTLESRMLKLNIKRMK